MNLVSEKLILKFNRINLGMSENEMKNRGAAKALKELSTSYGNPQSLLNVKTAQLLVLNEAQRLRPAIMEWAVEKCYTGDRAAYLDLFGEDEEVIESYIISTIFLLIGSLHVPIDGTKGNAIGIRHKTINRVDSLVFEGQLGFDRTWRFLEMLIDKCSFLIKDTSFKREASSSRIKQSYVCILPEKIKDILTFKAAKAFYPLPSTEKPVPWGYENGELVGGYASHQFDLIRRKSKIPYPYQELPQQVFDVANYIQDVPWRVNERVLHEVEQRLFKPTRGEFIKTAFPDKSGVNFECPIEDLTEEERLSRSKYYSALELYIAEVGDYESAVGKWRATKIALDIAKLYIGKIIYFPHNYDFRGRIYPISIGLSPQGSDAIKGVLEYAEGEVLTEEGEQWCWAYLASLYGNDKLPFNERVKRGKELILADFLEADEPYQFLSHQLELQRWVADNEYEVKTRIHLDACNSGSQFTSAITGDLSGCLATNVIPSPDGKRKDAYLMVAESATKTIEDIELKSDNEEFYLSLLRENGRKICKRPVMVSNYGGTAGGRVEIIFDMFRELNVPREFIDKKTASGLSKVIGQSIEGVLVGGKLFETYIQKFVSLIASKNKTISWTTPDGFLVLHAKYEKTIVQRSCKIGDKKVYINKAVHTKKLNKRQMKNASAPNYIHSLDAALLRMTAQRTMNRGVKNTSWIHDSFGTSPNNIGKMLHDTKLSFIKLIKSKPLDELDKTLRKSALKAGLGERSVNKIKPPKLRGFNLKRGLIKIFESEWFFS